MSVALWLLAVLGVIGAFDTFYYHEWRARLPAQGSLAAPELKIHAARDFFYAIIFGSLPWLGWHGRWVLVLAAVMWGWWALPTRLSVELHDVPAALTGLLLIMAGGVFLSGVRDLYAALELPHGNWPWPKEDR